MKTNSLHKNLTKRYLLWAYKTTRESFERIERKTTQLVVDGYLLEALTDDLHKGSFRTKALRKSIEDFKGYIAKKKEDELILKYLDKKRKTFHPDYLYLKHRLAAIEGAIKHFLGGKELKNIEKAFETEFSERIMKAREHS